MPHVWLWPPVSLPQPLWKLQAVLSTAVHPPPEVYTQRQAPWVDSAPWQSSEITPRRMLTLACPKGRAWTWSLKSSLALTTTRVNARETQVTHNLASQGPPFTTSSYF